MPGWPRAGRRTGAPSPISLPVTKGSTLWLIDPDGSNARQSRITRVLRYDWYLDSSRVIYTRESERSSGTIEMVAAHLESGDETVLLRKNATELAVSWDGRAVAYNSADGHFSSNRYILPLARPDSPAELPRSRGRPRAGHVRRRHLARAQRRLDTRRRVDRLHARLRLRRSLRRRSVSVVVAAYPGRGAASIEVRLPAACTSAPLGVPLKPRARSLPDS